MESNGDSLAKGSGLGSSLAILGRKSRVITLLPTGVSPHTYEPKPGQVKEIAVLKSLLKMVWDWNFGQRKLKVKAIFAGPV